MLIFEEFATRWIDDPSTTNAKRIFDEFQAPPVVIPVLPEVEEKPLPFLDFLTPDSPENNSPAEKCVKYHGLPSLLAARPDRMVIVEFINDIRVGDPTYLQQP